MAFASPVDAAVTLAFGSCCPGHLLLPRGLVLRWGSLRLEETAVRCLIFPALGPIEGRFVGRPVEALSVRGSKAFLLSVNTKVVDSVRVLEERRVSGVLLHVAPAAALPPARHKV
jgi:hypothetical protein